MSERVSKGIIPSPPPNAANISQWLKEFDADMLGKKEKRLEKSRRPLCKEDKPRPRTQIGFAGRICLPGCRCCYGRRFLVLYQTKRDTPTGPKGLILPDSLQIEILPPLGTADTPPLPLVSGTKP